MRIKPGTYFLIFLMLLMLYIMGTALTWEAFEPKRILLLVGSAIFILATVELVRELRTKGRTPVAAETRLQEKAETKTKWRRFGLIMTWVLGFLLSIYLLGFLVSIPIFVFSYLKAHGRGWLVSVAFAAIMEAFTYVVFVRLLYIWLYKGLLFSL